MDRDKAVPQRLASSAAPRTPRPLLPVVPPAIHGARPGVAALPLEHLAIADLAAPCRGCLDCPSASGLPSTARGAARGPRAPACPLAVDRAAGGVARALLLRGAVAGPPAVLARVGRAAPGLQAGPAARRARGPGGPRAPGAVDGARRGAAGLRDLELALAAGAAVLRRHLHAALVAPRPAAARGRALVPLAPGAQLAGHGAGLRVARLGLLPGARAGLPAVPVRPQHLAGPGPGAAPAGRGAAGPVPPVAQLAVRGALLRLAGLLLVPRAGAGRPTAGGLREDLTPAPGHAPAARLRADGPGVPLAPAAVLGAGLRAARPLLIAATAAGGASVDGLSPASRAAVVSAAARLAACCPS
mmetsp:Transcript_47905/g.136823  ORF Transcript_47905/g.136823 Transcript_47905/m.136823 type:complete len:358 (+) Transcript_47905:679-1752(+)